MRSILILLFNLLVLHGFCQTISHIQQLPIHYNPAYSGEKEKGRFAAYASIENGHQAFHGDSFTTINMYAIAYDNLKKYKKFSFGYGAELLSHQEKSNGTRSINKTSLYGFKAALAPKFLLKPKRLKPVSVSPAIGYTFVSSNHRLIERQSFSADYSSVSLKSFSNFSDNYFEFLPKTGHELNLGLLISRPGFQIGLSYSFMRYKILYDSYSYYSSDSLFSNNTIRNVTISRIEQNKGLTYNFNAKGFVLFLSKTFWFGKKRNFSLTPFVNVSSENPYYVPLTDKSITQNRLIYFIEWGTDILGVITQYKGFKAGIMLREGLYGEWLLGYANERFSVQLGLNRFLTADILIDDKLNGSLSFNYYLLNRF